MKRRGNCAFKAKQMDEAKILYSKAIEHDPTIVSLFGNRCAVNIAMSKYEDALKDADAAIKLDEKWVKGHYRKGQVLNKLGRHLESMSCFSAASMLKPDDKRMLKLVAEQLAKSKQPKKTMKKTSNRTKSAPPAPKRVAAAAKAKPVPQKDGEQDVKMRGYRVKADGSKTTFFNTEWDESTKDLYKDVGPKKIAAAKGEVITSKTGEASAWNTAGTYEECDASAWARKRLETLLASFEVKLPLNGEGCLRTTKLTIGTCEATRPVIRNTRRFLFEIDLEMEWEATLPKSHLGVTPYVAGEPIKGRIVYPEVTSDSERPFEWNVKCSGARPTGLALTKFGALQQMLTARVQVKLDTFCKEHRAGGRTVAS